MKFKNKYKINPEFENLFTFDSKEEELEHEAKMIMFRFLSEIEKINVLKSFKKKELASALGTSASYITQLYQGDKLINLLTLAKIQDVYNITFDISAKNNYEDYHVEIETSAKKEIGLSCEYLNNSRIFEIYVNPLPDYNKNAIEHTTQDITLKIAS